MMTRSIAAVNSSAISHSLSSRALSLHIPRSNSAHHPTNATLRFQGDRKKDSRVSFEHVTDIRGSSAIDGGSFQ